MLKGWRGSDEDLRRAAPLFTSAWLFDVLPRALRVDPLKLFNSDGDEILFHRVNFPLAEAASADAVATRLNQLDLRQASATFWNWLGNRSASGSMAKSGKGITFNSHPASVEDVNYQSPRGLDRALFLKLAACDWIAERRNLLLTGASGLGKSWLACALGHKACRENMSKGAIAHGDARYARLLRSLARVKLLILDDWGPEALTPDQARDLLEIVEDRYDKGSLIITSQVPVDRWHDLIGVPTLADAILDRVIHNAYRIELAGESLRKRRPSP